MGVIFKMLELINKRNVLRLWSFFQKDNINSFKNNVYIFSTMMKYLTKIDITKIMKIGKRITKQVVNELSKLQSLSEAFNLPCWNFVDVGRSHNSVERLKLKREIPILHILQRNGNVFPDLCVSIKSSP